MTTKKPKDNGEDESFVPFYGSGAEIYMSLKLSKDGLSREEDVDVLKGMYEPMAREKNIGVKLRRHLSEAQRENND